MSQSFAVSPFVLVVILGCIVTFAYEMWIHRHKPLHESSTAFGTAAWGRVKELAKAGHLCASGLILGRAKSGKLIRWKSDRHLITVAPTRSGKGVSCIIPNLLTYEGSAFVIDPKGENAAITAKRRRSLNQEVYVLDPWRISGEEVSCFNPLEGLDPESADLAEDAARIAGALVLSGSHKESHWENEAKAFIAGLILHVVTSEPERERHLPKVRELLTLGESPFEKLLDAMAESQAAHGLVARASNRMKQKASKERSAVVSTAQANTHFLDSPRMAQNLSRSDFSFSHLKTQRVSVYLVLPAERIPEYNRWLRLLVAVSLNDLARTIGRPKKPVLFVLDEFAALGHMEPIETAMGLMAGFGVQLWPILQDLSQLKHLYGARWQTFLANCGALQAFNVAEHGTAEYLSSLLGKRTVNVKNLSAGRSGGYDTKLTKSIGESFSATSRALLMPDEVMRLSSDETLVFIQGARPLRLKKLRYYAEPEFRGLFNKNPHRISAVPVVSMPETPAETQSAKVVILPPHAKTILSYAVHAWAAEKGIERVQGLPKLPLATEWIPALFIIIHTEGWNEETKRLARLGMAMTSVPASIAMSLDGAFSHPEFRAMLMDALTDYAAKANLPTASSEQPFWLWFAAAQRKREELSISA